MKIGDQFDLNIQPTKIQDEKFDQPIKLFDLYQNHPNPFNSSMAIRFNLLHAAEVEIKIFNLRGALIDEIFPGEYPAGFYQIGWNGTERYGNSVASSIYYCCLMAGNCN
jgi:hypothetical protein